MAVGMQDQDRPRRRDAVEVGGDDAPRAEKDRVEAPGEQRRLGVRHGVVGLDQALDHRLDAVAAGPAAAFGVGAGMKAGVGEGPDPAFHGVAVALDQSRHQHQVAEAVIAADGTPGGSLGLPTHGQHAPVAHGDMGRLRAGRVHGDDLARAEDSGVLGHGQCFLLLARR